jgi:small subunit ribosomal protein S21
MGAVPGPALDRFVLVYYYCDTGYIVKIEVVDNQIEPALKSLKREMLKGGVFKEMKLRAYYEKPSVRRKRKQAEARRKRLKAARRSRATLD